MQTEGENDNSDCIDWESKLLPIMMGLFQACDVPMPALPGAPEIPPLPGWAKKICRKLGKTIFKRFLKLRPTGETVGRRNKGRIFGVGQRAITFFAEASKGLECMSPDEAAHHSSAEPDSLNPQELLKALQEAASASIQKNLKGNAADQQEFFAGLTEGLQLFLDEDEQFVGDRAARIFTCTCLPIGWRLRR